MTQEEGTNLSPPVLELDEALAERLDPTGQFAAVASLGGQLERGWEAAAAALEGVSVLGAAGEPADGVVVCAMGGSAIGADVVRACVVDTLRAPFEVVRGYELPAWVSSRTLVVGVSHSGDTEETLSCVRGALARECRVVAVTSGGELAALARERSLPLVVVPGDLQPRASLGHLVAPLGALLERIDLTEGFAAQIDEAASVVRGLASELDPAVPEAENLAKRLARRLWGHTVLIYGAALAASAARRWKGQVNENANAPAFFAELPEANHNEFSSWTAAARVSRGLHVVFLEDRLAPERLRRRVALTQELVACYVAGVDVVESRGESPLARVLSLATVGDHTSLYLALLYGVDPAAVEAITWLKRRMAGEEVPWSSRGDPAALAPGVADGPDRSGGDAAPS
jgi:glucose/mannose-6-phosphate isomerase